MAVNSLRGSSGTATGERQAQARLVALLRQNFPAVEIVADVRLSGPPLCLADIALPKVRVAIEIKRHGSSHVKRQAEEQRGQSSMLGWAFILISSNAIEAAAREVIKRVGAALRLEA